MPKPKEVVNVTVSEGTRFIAGGGAVQVRTVQYFVTSGRATDPVHGPFFFSAPVTEFSEEAVQRAMEETVKQLRGVGALLTT